ncbi:hypothetical protein BG841_03940 [Marinobacter sp. X15-166B]|nr:hypothetical protein BG841_03940 [Marinobacter sp. X15-166B]
MWLAPTLSGKLHRPLSPRWEVLPVQINQPPAPLRSAHHIRVGVIDLTDSATPTHPHLEHWLDLLSPVSWVALTPALPAAAPPLNHLISTYCADYHTLPLDPLRLNNVLGHLWGMANLQARLHQSQALPLQHQALSGNSMAIRQTRSLLRRFASTMEPVLICGQSGTGKEAAARFVHAHSPVSNGPFIAINCAALPPSFTQSELLGHDKDAIAGVAGERSGRTTAARGGSLLLMGIDELLAEQQSALLRFLQEGMVDRVGGHQMQAARPRVIVTSSRPLQELVANNQFRGDVYYRLGGLRVALPELHQRLEDIPLLTREYLRRISPEQPRCLTEDAMRCLLTHTWPGNLRELDNRLRQAVLLSNQETITARELGFTPTRDGSTTGLSLEQFRARAEKQALTSTLALTNNNVAAAARLLNISRVSLYRLMEKHHTTHRRSGRRSS